MQIPCVKHCNSLFSIFTAAARRAEVVIKSRCVSLCLSIFLSCQIFFGHVLQHRRQTSSDVARLLLMAPIDPWQNFTPIFGAVAFCTTNIKDFRTPLTSTSSTISLTYSFQKRSLWWTSSKRIRREVIEVDQLGDTNNKRLS